MSQCGTVGERLEWQGAQVIVALSHDECRRDLEDIGSEVTLDSVALVRTLEQLGVVEREHQGVYRLTRWRLVRRQLEHGRGR